MAALRPESVTALAGSSACAVAWRSRRQLHLTVIVKASFAFAPDADMRRVEPQPIIRAEVHHGKSPGRSVRLTTDLAPYLARADVVFTGHAHAPPGGRVSALPVRLAVFDRDKALLDKALAVRDPAGFQRLPMVYERAYGGVGFADNPFGVGAVATSGEPAIVDPKDLRRPAGLGPFGSAWPIRKRLLGATRRAVLEGPIAEIPDDFDWSYYQVAPADQRTPHLGGGEWILLEGLHPTLPRLRTRLPGARGLARVYGLAAFGVAEGQLLELVADTLHIEGDEQRCTVVWRRSFPLYAEEALAAVRVVGGVEVAGAALSWPEAPAPDGESPAARAPRIEPGAPTLAVPAEASQGATVCAIEEPDAAARPALPFGRAGAAPAVAAAAALPQRPAAGPAPDAGGTIALTLEDEKGFRTLPFVDVEPDLLPTSAPPRSVTHAPVRPLPARAPSPSPPSLPAAPAGDGGLHVRVVHQTPFAVAVAPSGLAPGRHAVTVTVAATCDLVIDGPARLRPKAEPPTDDLASIKARADVTLAGHAHPPAPGARRGEVSLRFGHEGNAFERRVAIFGDRRWLKGKRKGLPTMTEPEPFDRIPLDHEHAYGGPGHPENPAGRGHDLPVRACDQALLPNVEDPEHLIRSLAHEPEPACLGPVPPAWRERAPAGDRDQVAPVSQQLAFLAGDEPFEIEGARPRGAMIKGSLPGVRARCFARMKPGAGGAFVEVPLQLDTAAFDADAMTLRLVSRGTLPVEDEGAPGKTVAALFVMIETQPGERATLAEARVRLEGR